MVELYSLRLEYKVCVFDRLPDHIYFHVAAYHPPAICAKEKRGDNNVSCSMDGCVPLKFYPGFIS